MNRRDWLRRILPWSVVGLGGTLLQLGLAPPPPRADWSGLRPVAGQGVLLAVLGGWRAPAADVLWLRANAAWERRDSVQTEALLRAAVALEPDFDYFRINAARMLAFDLPEWRSVAGEPPEQSRGRRTMHAERAVELLEARPTASTATLIERARLTHQALGDRSGAAAIYREAALQPDEPYFAGRLAVELLVQEGRTREARDWLRRWLPRLPADQPAAQRGRMERRLAELEQATQ